MFEVIRNGKVLFRNASYQRCLQFKARHKLNAIIRPMPQMLAA
jgi:hypothetical protein